VFIESVYIQNFRCIEKAEVRFDRVTSFVGRNGVGKSTVLYALEAFYSLSLQHTELDYYNHDTDRAIRIRVTYGGLKDDELAEFNSYVHNGKLTVTKVITTGGAKYYGTTMQFPRFAELRKMGARDRRSALKGMIEAREITDFGDLPARGEDVDRAMEAYEAAHPELLELTDAESQFFGPKNVGGGKLDKFTKFVLVPAVRDAGSETEKRGAIMQLLDLIVTRSLTTREDFVRFNQEFEERAKALYGKDNLPELAELGRLITARLARYAPGAELMIDFAELQPPPMPIPDALVTVSEDQFRVPVRYSGHGLQRALILALLEQLSLTLPARPASPDDAQDDKKAQRQPDLILGIEEPELYQHPARSRHLAAILRGLTDQEPEGAGGIQVATVTHSPYFVDVEHFDEIRMCKKLPGQQAEHPKVTGITQFSRAEAAARLSELTGGNPADFTAVSFVTRAAPVLNSIVNEGLFADIAVVVEGESDVVALWALQKQVGQRWEELGVVVVPVGGKSKIDRAVIAFQGFGIPTYFLFDGDKAGGKASEAGTNRLLLKLGGGAEADFPPTTVTDQFAAFEENIEGSLSDALGDDYVPIRDACAAEAGHDKPSTALKNPEVMQLFMFRCLQQGRDLAVLREIVQRVTAIATSVRQHHQQQDQQAHMGMAGKAIPAR
jgi:putative ATP-dependent endonuclease of the OLD family